MGVKDHSAIELRYSLHCNRHNKYARRAVFLLLTEAMLACRYKLSRCRLLLQVIVLSTNFAYNSSHSIYILLCIALVCCRNTIYCLKLNMPYSSTYFQRHWVFHKIGLPGTNQIAHLNLWWHQGRIHPSCNRCRIYRSYFRLNLSCRNFKVA